MKPRRPVLRHHVIAEDPADPRRRLFLGPLGLLTTDLDLAVEYPGLGRARAVAEEMRRRHPGIKFACASF